MDTTVAVSEPGVNVVLHKAIALAHTSGSDSGTWGPFFASYTASVALAGGTATLENAPANKLDLAGVNVSGVITGTIGFDLGLILPHICIPPFQVCVDLGWFGTFCTPQFCITWPHADVTLSLPFSFNLDVSFGFRVDDLGSQWGIVLLIDPFSPRFDLTPMGPVIVAAILRRAMRGVNAPMHASSAREHSARMAAAGRAGRWRSDHVEHVQEDYHRDGNPDEPEQEAAHVVSLRA